jgi:hypothetical protein
MKKTSRLVLFSALFDLLLVSCAASGASSVQSASSISNVSVALSSASSIPSLFTLKKTPTYYFSPAKTDSQDFYFLADNDEIPYLPIEEAANLLDGISGDENSTVLVRQKDKIYTLTRSDNETMGGNLVSKLDFNAGTIAFENYDAFFQRYWFSTPIDPIVGHYLDKDGKPIYLERETSGNHYRKGQPVTFDLKSHSLPMLYDDGKGYLPAKIFADIFLQPFFIDFYYQDGAAYFTDNNNLKSAFGEQIYKEQTDFRERSAALSAFTYNELVFNLDYFYGLKPEHNITSFDEFLTLQGYKEDLLKGDPIASGNALCKLLYRDLADHHSNIYEPSPYAYKNAKDTGWSEMSKGTPSSSYFQIYSQMKLYSAARASAFPEGVPSYQEIGDTAYVTFDSFDNMDTIDHYGTAGLGTKDSIDAAGIIQYAHSQIMRDSTPIKNVVVDLSLNRGGSVDTGVYLTGWMLGDGVQNVLSRLDGSLSETFYKTDINLDHAFDEKDVLANKRLFCITSPFSFSCANSTSAFLHDSEMVTMLGRKSAGGACIVRDFLLADGTAMILSDYDLYVHIKNGVPASVDDGVTPDVEITAPEDFYDRAKLTGMIDGLL